MRLRLLFLILLCTPSFAQVLDVNGDNKVGPDEAIALKEHWKGLASTPNDHDHLGQTWSRGEEGRPLRIRGDFPRRSPNIPLPLKGFGIPILQPIEQAPLILDNTSTSGHGLIVRSENVGASISGDPTLVLEGSFPIIAATDESNPILNLISNGSVQIFFDQDNTGGEVLAVAGPLGLVALFRADGDLLLIGEVTKSSGKTIVDHPLDPANRFLTHTSIDSSERLNSYSGNIVLDEKGEGWVELPSFFESYNTDYRYNLTCVGGFSPVYISEEIESNQFKVSGGSPGLKVSWQVTGVRDDPYAKAHPIEVEVNKTGAEKGKFLHPSLYGKGGDESIPLRKVKEKNP